MNPHQRTRFLNRLAADRRIGHILTAARDAQTPYGLDVVPAIRCVAYPTWWGHPELPDAVGRLVVALRRGQAVRDGAVLAESIHPEIAVDDMAAAEVLTGQALLVAAWRLAVDPDARPCPLCLAVATTGMHLSPAERDGLCHRHAGTTTRTEAHQ